MERARLQPYCVLPPTLVLEMLVAKKLEHRTCVEILLSLIAVAQPLWRVMAQNDDSIGRAPWNCTLESAERELMRIDIVVFVGQQGRR